jgi:rare lipoprotein A (peptidoglycan hydrolase)
MWYRFSAVNEQAFEQAYDELIKLAKQWIADKESLWIQQHKNADPKLARVYGWSFIDLIESFKRKFGFVRGQGLTGPETDKYTISEKIGEQKIIKFNPNYKNEINKIIAIRKKYNLKWQSFLDTLYKERMSLKQSDPNIVTPTTVSGLAFGNCRISVYGLDFKNKDDHFHGKVTANGERFNSDDFTCAHKTLPMNTVVEFWNPAWGDKYDANKAVRVRINDRGPYKNNADFDITRAIAAKLGVDYGVHNIQYRILR